MTELRRPFLVLAACLMALVLLVELGSSLVVGGGTRVSDLTAHGDELEVQVTASGVTEPPGRGISYLALVDGIVAYSLALMVAGLLVPERVHGRVQGVVTLVGSIVLIVVALVLAIVALVELVVMVSLFFSTPFGTIAYLALWGFFPRGTARSCWHCSWRSSSERAPASSSPTSGSCVSNGSSHCCPRRCCATCS